MTDDLIHQIPQPDKSGAIENQTAAPRNHVIINPESPMGMGQAISGLAAEAGGFNKSARQLIAASWSEDRKAYNEAEEQLKKLLPENSMLKERVANLQTERKSAVIINLLGVIVLTIGATILSGSDATIHPSGWLLVVAGIALCFVDIINSLLRKN